MNPNVLVIAYYFPPMGLSGVQRTLKFVKYLPLYNWNPIVLTTDPVAYYAFDNELMNEIDGITIYRTPNKKAKKYHQKSFPSYLTQKLGRLLYNTIYIPDSKISWKKPALKLAEKILENHKINVIFATAPPFTDFLIAKELAEKYNKPFIIDYRDIWNGNPFYYYPTPLHLSKSLKLENDLLKKTEKVIVTTRFAKEFLLKKFRFLNHQDIAIIPHGFDPKDFENIHINPSEKFVITHSGAFQDNRTPKYFLKAVAEFISNNPSTRSDFELRFVGLMRKSHLRLIKKYALDDITICTGYLPHSETIKHLLESDVLWFMQFENFRTPGKLFEYFGARKTILACIPDGQIKKIALDSQSAIATDPDDIKQIKNAIGKLYYWWKNGSLPKPDENFVAQFDRTKLTANLAKELLIVADL